METLSYGLWISLFLSGSQPLLADDSEKGEPGCFSYSSPVLEKKITYCIHRSRPDLPPSSGEPVSYYMHGIGGNHKHWVNAGYQTSLEKLGRIETLPAITIVSFDTAKMSYFIDQEGKNTGSQAYETWFINEFIPKIEREFQVCARRECRSVIGTSMGGMGALNMGLRHRDLFFLMAANAPALFPYNIFDSTEKWMAYMMRHPVGPIKGGVLLLDGRRAFLDWDFFDQHDVCWLTENWAQNEKFPALFFDMGGNDSYGFQEGYGRFLEILKKKKLPFRANFIPDGEHGMSDQPERREALLRFLLENHH